MNRIDTSEDELDRLMDRIRAEITEQDRRAAAAGTAEAAPEPQAAAAAPAAGGKRKRSVKLKSLLRRDDGEFVDACFRSILGRSPAAGELAYHRDRLRSGRLRKLALVEELRFGKEGRKRGTLVKGLRARRALAALGRLPGLATLASWARLPRLTQNVHRIRRQSELLGQAVERLPAELGDRLDGASRELSGLRDALEGRLDRQEEDIAALRRELPVALGAAVERGLARLPAFVDERLQAGQARLERLLDERLARQRDEFAGRLGQLERDLAAVRGAAEAGSAPLAAGLAEIEQRLVVVQRALVAPGGRPGTAEAGAEDAAPPLSPAADADALYAAFEDCFRGTREDIRRRQLAHVGLLERQEGGHLAGLPVIDLGCGRGEWLEILRERSIRAVGVDRNRVFLADLAARGLAAVEADALAHLRGLPDASARAVTAFHLAEHLPFGTLLALLDEALRVLAEGGLLLLETPNPENLVTAAHRFHRDPTHVRPIPPDVATFLLRARGFRDVSVRRLHEDADPAREEVGGEVLRGLLFGPQDYAIVGYR